MFREMRRKRQELDQDKCITILEEGTSGVLALTGEEGYPYAVPMSYVYDEGKLFFHSAKSGHKIDAIARNRKASFCVIHQDKIVPEEYTTYFRSVIVFGKIQLLQDDTEKRKAIEKLAVKYAPDDCMENRNREIERTWSSLCMLEMQIEHMSGKEAIELVREKSQKKEKKRLT